MATNDLQFTLIRLGARLDYVVPVILAADITNLFTKLGYQISVNPSNLEHIVGQKSDTEVYLDGSKRVFGARSDTVSNTVSALEKFKIAITKNLNVDLGHYVSFYEFEIQGYFDIEKEIYEVFSGLYQDSSDLKVIQEIMGGKYSQFSLKLVPSGKNINTPEWHELTIEPKVNSAGYTLSVRMVCRSPKLEAVQNIAMETGGTVQSMIYRVLLKSS
jgi:hypothetical protein